MQATASPPGVLDLPASACLRLSRRSRAWWRSSAGMLTALASRSAVMAWGPLAVRPGSVPTCVHCVEAYLSGVALTALKIGYSRRRAGSQYLPEE